MATYSKGDFLAIAQLAEDTRDFVNTRYKEMFGHGLNIQESQALYESVVEPLWDDYIHDYLDKTDFDISNYLEARLRGITELELSQIKLKEHNERMRVAV